MSSPVVKKYFLSRIAFILILIILISILSITGINSSFCARATTAFEQAPIQHTSNLFDSLHSNFKSTLLFEDPNPLINPFWALTTNGLSSVRYEMATTILPDGKVFVVGGRTYFDNSTSAADIFDPQTGQWRATTSSPVSRASASATLLNNGKVLVTGGFATGSIGVVYSRADIFDPLSEQWSSVSRMNIARVSHTTTLLPNGKVLVIGGQDGSFRPTNSAEIYDPITDIWTIVASSNDRHLGHTTTLLPSGNILVIGGYNCFDQNCNGIGEINSAEIYDPTANVWTAITVPRIKRVNATATLLPNGKVLVTGGDQVTPADQQSTEIFDPATNTWNDGPSMSVGRTFHTAVLLKDNTVLVAGGLCTITNYSTCEVYDPSNNTWTTSARLNTGRYFHNGVLLNNGSYLVIGGQDTNGTTLSTTEIYTDPFPASISLMADESTSCQGVPLKLTATITPSSATGTVKFFDGNTLINSAAISNGVAFITTSSLIAGNHNLTAMYSGDGINISSTSSVVQQLINSTPVAPTVSNNGPIIVGQTLQLFSSTVPGATYFWSGPSNFVSSDQNPVISDVTLNYSGVYSLIVTVENCPSSVVTTNVTVMENPPPNITINDVTVTEGNSGSTTAIFTVLLSSASNQVVTVDFATADGTAIAGSDYIANSGTITFPAGTTSQTIPIAVIGDTESETDESFSVNLSNPVNAVVGTGHTIEEIAIDIAPAGGNLIGLGNNRSSTKKLTWLNKLTPKNYPATLNIAEIGWSLDILAPGDGLQDGQSVTLLVYKDPEGDGPSSGQSPDLVKPIRVALPGSTNLAMYDVSSANLTINSGSFIIGVVDDVNVKFPATSATSANLPSGSGSFYSTDNGATFSRVDNGFSSDFSGVLGQPRGSWVIRAKVLENAGQGIATIINDEEPNINSFSPNFGPVGTNVTITGTNFIGVKSVQFNGSVANFTINSETSITATVPAGAITGKISLSSSTTSVSSANNFIITANGLPSITSFSPTSGPIGKSITVSGINFTAATSVKFNGVSANFQAGSDTSLIAMVPTGATSGPVSITTPLGTGTSSTNFIIAPGIDSFTPTSGAVGTSVTITGTNFTGTTSVKFNGITATFTLVSPTSIKATVPTTAGTGPITVTNASGTGISSTDFAVTPVITNFTPTSGVPGTSVTINGSGFTGATAVQFNSIAATTFSVVSSSSIKANVPVGATTGKVAVVAPGGTATSTSNFTVTVASPPTITSISPASGTVGTIVTISGSNLLGPISVKFNGTSATTINSVSATMLTAAVPTGATSGKISVTTSAGTATSTAIFTVQSSLPTLSSFTPTSGLPGTKVTLTGTNLNSGVVVKFNGLKAVIGTIAATSLSVTVPEGAATGKITVTNSFGNATSANNFNVAGTCAIAPITVGQTINSALATTDCKSPIRGTLFNADRYSFTGTAGQQITISASSFSFDAFLFLIGPDGSVIVQNDDGGNGDGNARIPVSSGTFTLPASGTYIIEVTSFNPSVIGNYSLILQ